MLLLAAGASSRMRGRDKLLEEIGGVPLLRHHAHQAMAVTDRVCVALPDEHPFLAGRLAALDGLDLHRLHVAEAGEGLSGTIRGALAQMPGFNRLMLLLADLPEITTDDLRIVLKSSEDEQNNLIWRGATEDGRPGHPVIFDASLRPAFSALAGDSGGQSVIAAHRDRLVLVPLPGQHALRDLDTPEDWAAWRDETASR